MTETRRPGVLLVDDDESLLKSLVRLLRSTTQRPILTASTAEAADVLLSENEVGVITCEPYDARLGAFLVKAGRQHPNAVCIVLTGYPNIAGVMKAINKVHPFTILTKPWLDEELVATVELGFEQYAINRKRDQLIDEYNDIRTNAETFHAVHVLNALQFSAHLDMNFQAIQNLSVGTLLLTDDGATQINAAARRFLATHGWLAPGESSAVADLPTVLSALVGAAQDAPRGQRLKHRGSNGQQFDYVVQDIVAGTLIAFAPRPQVTHP